MTSILFILAGFVGLMLGGETLVRGAVYIAQRMRVSPLVIGLTLVGFGTSTPELVTSVQAALLGAPGIAVGNVIGSNIANILLILGLTAIIAPLAVSRESLRRDGAVMILASLALVGLVQVGVLSRNTGIIFLLGLAGYIIFALRPGSAEPMTDGLPDSPRRPLWVALALTLGGLALTIFAARLLVIGATDLARALEVSEAVIGLTIVAIGTSLPELVTSLIAARRGQSDLAFGNIIGSNIFNILGILGVTAIVAPLDIPARFAGVDIWVMMAAAFALMVFARTGWRIGRSEGGSLLCAFAGYSLYLGMTA
ncbi:calcium/sodium antiporter [Marimonas sp. MJW-29]|uniref:Calcium/sodium antiporter n=1 Tax=Sulfitobacter sediminis TaxID=3234186 RepID=A0ABV3RHU9_9RHOB